MGLALLTFVAVGAVLTFKKASTTPFVVVNIEQKNAVMPSIIVPSLPPPPQAGNILEPIKGNVISIVDGRTGQSRDIPIGGASKVIAVNPVPTTAALPQIQADGTKPYELYAQAFRPKSAEQAKLPRIALIVGGVGLDASITQRALDILPSSVTLAFAAPAAGVEAFAERARAKGHELLVQIPFESASSNVETPYSLKASLPTAENISRLHLSLARMPQTIGVINYGGDKLMRIDTAFTPILKDLTQRGLLMVDDASMSNLTLDIGKRIKTAALKADVVLGNDASFTDLEKFAKSQGAAIGYVLLNKESVEKLANFAKLAESKGYLVTPLTAILSRKGI